jgi:hypothetical protein
VLAAVEIFFQDPARGRWFDQPFDRLTILSKVEGEFR